MEGLSLLLEYATISGEISSFYSGNLGISHLIFANDLMLFWKAKPSINKNLELNLLKFSSMSA